MRYLYTFLLGAMALVAAQSITEKPPAPQPIPFNHKQHVSLAVKCGDCHTMRKPGFAAGYPGEATCMGCHVTVKKDTASIQKLAEFAKSKKPVPWVKVYRVPDYVWFSHELHNKEAGIECAECHGQVSEREVIVKEKATSMKACMDCHDKRKASNECDVCHDKR